ncbi:patatin-like phospholipase family protein [Microbacterium sp. KHB019]|uniref:patatin-like phospholipase family protein n=1 Tax=Microbacterium sp. KHB019 TaxID=3129770 RepID=UPI00307A1711
MTRALVLGGGGSAGNAWTIGVLAGLLEGGVDAAAADLIIGTSAGATAAVQITSGSASELYTAILDAQLPPQSQRGRPSVDHLARTGAIIASASDAADMRRRMGAAAIVLDDESDGAWETRWRAITAHRLPDAVWPERRMLIAAVDARTGEPVTFDAASGVDIVDAVAASTSSGAAYRIGDGRYIDGGYRRNENADLAAGHDRVLVLSPLGGRTRHPLAWRMQLAAQVDDLRAVGSAVSTILPDESSLAASGDDLMDPSVRRPAAEAGYRQGRAAASALAEFWG